MKKLLLITLIIIVSGFVPKPTNAAVPLPIITIAGSTKTEFRICKIRRLFCGQTAVLIISIAIFIIGFLMVIGKLNWGIALFSIAGIVIFYNAESIARTFQGTLQFALIENPLCNCACPLGDNLLMEAIDNPETLKPLIANVTTNIAECIPKFGGAAGQYVNPARDKFADFLKGL